MQLVDVLLGSVGYAFKLKYGNQAPSKGKGAVLKYIQNKLNIEKLSESFNKRKIGGHFKVDEFVK